MSEDQFSDIASKEIYVISHLELTLCPICMNICWSYFGQFGFHFIHALFIFLDVDSIGISVISPLLNLLRLTKI